jgi:hypothetical protein
MAKARRVEVESKPTKDMRDVQLTLSVAEAETLLDITQNIGGSTQTSRRVHTDRIESALRSAGVTRPCAKYADGVKSGIYYDNEPVA